MNRIRMFLIALSGVALAAMGIMVTAEPAHAGGAGDTTTVTMHDIVDTTVLDGHVAQSHKPVLEDDLRRTPVISFAFTSPLPAVADGSPFTSAQLHIFVTSNVGNICVYRAALSSPISNSPKQPVPTLSTYLGCQLITQTGWNTMDISADVQGEVYSPDDTATYVFYGGNFAAQANSAYIDIQTQSGAPCAGGCG